MAQSRASKQSEIALAHSTSLPWAGGRARPARSNDRRRVAGVCHQAQCGSLYTDRIWRGPLDCCPRRL